MARPRPDLEEEGYKQFCLYPNKSDKHMMTRISQTLGIPRITCVDWRKRYEWDKRWLEDTHVMKRKYFEIGEAVLLDNLRPLMERLGEIGRTGNDRDAVQAIKVFAGITGLDQSGGVNIVLNQPHNQLIAEMKDLSLQEMRKLLVDQGQQNIDAARITKTSKARQLPG
jgi:hypothetical protein